MTIGNVIILAVVQGVTEFLPVSSSGHLVLAREVFGISDGNGTAFDAFLHLGTLLAVLWFYRQTWWELVEVILKPTQADAKKRTLFAFIAVATVPAAVVGWGLHEAADMWRTDVVVGVGLLLTACLLLVSEIGKRKLVALGSGDGEITWRVAIGVGLAQVLALFPGVSRSGSTIAAGQLLGMSREEAVRFSFLLSAPIIAGAGLSSVGSVVGSGVPGWQLVVGLMVAFGSGLVAISALTQWVARNSLIPFVVYLVVVGGIVLVH